MTTNYLYVIFLHTYVNFGMCYLAKFHECRRRNFLVECFQNVLLFCIASPFQFYLDRVSLAEFSPQGLQCAETQNVSRSHNGNAVAQRLAIFQATREIDKSRLMTSSKKLDINNNKIKLNQDYQDIHL